MSSFIKILCGMCTQMLGNCKYKQLNPCNHFFHLTCLRKVFHHPKRYNAKPGKCPQCGISSISRDDVEAGLENSPIRKRVKLSELVPREGVARNRRCVLESVEELPESNTEVPAEIQEEEEMESGVEVVEGNDEILDQEMEVEIVEVIVPDQVEVQVIDLEQEDDEVVDIVEVEQEHDEVLDILEVEEDDVEEQPMGNGVINEAGAQQHNNNADPEEVSQDDIDFIEGLKDKNPRNIRRFYLQVRIKRHDAHGGPFKCHFCAKAFNIHQTRRTHEEESHFERINCAICQVRFRRHTNFVSHMRVVHQNPEFRQSIHGGRRPN